MLLLANGTLYPITATGVFTIQRVRLNRIPLIAHRLRNQQASEDQRLLEELRGVLQLQEQLQEYHATLIEEQKLLLQQQRELLVFLIQLLDQ
jgi:hypothetical protein